MNDRTMQSPTADTCDMPLPVYRVIAKRLRQHAGRNDRSTFDLVARVNGIPAGHAEQIWLESAATKKK